MKYLDEFRDSDRAKRMVDRLANIVEHSWSLMEVCGGQTHSIIRNGIDQILPPGIGLIHGPGCPVCVTPISVIDQALAIAAKKDVVFCTFGDMLRVPGSDGDLFSVKASGADVRVVYSPMDCLKVARENPTLEVVFLAIGFETTAPTVAATVHTAEVQGIRNFSVLVSHVLVPPAIESILSSPANRVHGFLAAGHVCCVTGYQQYHSISRSHGVPIVVTGFEPLDLLEGIYRVVRQLESGQAFVENAYSRAVNESGNLTAMSLIDQVFEVTDRDWRGLGTIPSSGWQLSDSYREFDAESRFELDRKPATAESICRAGEVLIGAIKPCECEAFGTLCTPRHPLGATMVSSEGACAAYYQYGRISGTATGR